MRPPSPRTALRRRCSCPPLLFLLLLLVLACLLSTGPAGVRAFLLPTSTALALLRPGRITSRLLWVTAAASTSSPSSWTRGASVLLAAAQQSSEGQGPRRDNAVRSLFTDTAERRRQQQETAAAVKEAEERAAANDDEREDTAAAAAAGSRRNSMAAARGDVNVLGGALETCGTDPMTGFTREGCCTTGPEDFGSHTVCAIVNDAFLAYSRARGNDLVTPRPEFRFPGLKDGDRWCLCASRWREALEAGVAPRVVLSATHRKALEVCALSDLVAHAVDPPPPTAAAEGATAGAGAGKEEL